MLTHSRLFEMQEWKEKKMNKTKDCARVYVYMIFFSKTRDLFYLYI